MLNVVGLHVSEQGKVKQNKLLAAPTSNSVPQGMDGVLELVNTRHAVAGPHNRKNDKK